MSLPRVLEELGSEASRSEASMQTFEHGELGVTCNPVTGNNTVRRNKTVLAMLLQFQIINVQRMKKKVYQTLSHKRN